MQRGVGLRVAGLPEAGPAAPDVPVGQVVDEPAQPGGAGRASKPSSASVTSAVASSSPSTQRSSTWSGRGLSRHVVVGLGGRSPAVEVGVTKKLKTFHSVSSVWRVDFADAVLETRRGVQGWPAEKKFQRRASAPNDEKICQGSMTLPWTWTSSARPRRRCARGTRRCGRASRRTRACSPPAASRTSRGSGRSPRR